MSYLIIHNLIITTYLCLGIYCFFKPKYLVYLLFGLTIIPCIPTIPYNDDTLLELVQLGSIKIYVYDYLITITIIMLIYNHAKNSNQIKYIINTPISIGVVILFVWIIFISTISYFKGFSLQNILRHLSTYSSMLMAFFIPQTINTNKEKDDFFKFTIFAGIVLVIFALIRYFITKELVYTSSETARTLPSNSIIILTLPLCYILFQNKILKFNTIKSSISVLLLAIGVCLAGFRSGWIVFFIIISMYIIDRLKSNIKLLWMPMLGATAITLIIFISVIHPINKLNAGKSLYSDVIIRVADTFNLQNKTTQGRLSNWEFAIEVMQKNPFLGLARLPVHTLHSDQSNIIATKFNDVARDAHNIFFETMIHQGIFGVSILILFYYFTIREARRLANINLDYSRFLFVYLITFIIFSMMNTSFASISGKSIFFIVVGFLNNELFRLNCHNKQCNLHYLTSRD